MPVVGTDDRFKLNDTDFWFSNSINAASQARYQISNDIFSLLNASVKEVTGSKWHSVCACVCVYFCLNVIMSGLFLPSLEK